MNTNVFLHFYEILESKNLLRSTINLSVEEEVAIFLPIVGHNERNRVMQRQFQISNAHDYQLLYDPFLRVTYA